jgi:7,8-dihydropterin-6-yl-methyl-4-(beta-D-ribofuranosyl)aminobenzene 5'-phosphate synthase
MGQMTRRDFVAGSCLLAGTSLVLSSVKARGATLTVPEIDRLSIRVVIDSGHELYLDKTDSPFVRVERSGLGNFGGGKQLQSLNSQWGLSLYLESTAGSVTRREMLDFGTTSEVLLNNLRLLKVDPAQLDGLIVSHGHADHYGGLPGFLERFRSELKSDIGLVVGGEDNFCWQHSRLASGEFVENGVLDRADLKRFAVSWSTAEQPRVMYDHAFSTGPIARDSIEKVLPNSWVEYGTHNGVGCDASHFTEAERQGHIVPNQHWHEHATCFNLRGRGLVVISSCGHAGIINSVRQAQKVSGVNKVHAIIGGFHLFPAQTAYVADIVRGIKELQPDLLIPMHCSGVNFIAAAHDLMPDQLVTSTTGNRFTLGA